MGCRGCETHQRYPLFDHTKKALVSRAWTNVKGKKIEADLLSVEGENALLRIKDKIHKVPLKTLSDESQAKIKAALEEKKK